MSNGKAYRGCQSTAANDIKELAFAFRSRRYAVKYRKAGGCGLLTLTHFHSVTHPRTHVHGSPNVEPASCRFHKTRDNETRHEKEGRSEWHEVKTYLIINESIAKLRMHM